MAYRLSSDGYVKLELQAARAYDGRIDDALNRVTQVVQYTGAGMATVNKSFTYDNCTNGIGGKRLCNKLHGGFFLMGSLIFGVFALPLLFSGAIANAGTVSGMDGPHRVPWAFRVELKRERIISFKKLGHIDSQEINNHSAKWLAAMATIDAEIAQIVTKLAKAHPHVQISSVTGRNNPGFLLRGSDEEARAMADEAAVESVESLGAADEVIENPTMNLWE